MKIERTNKTIEGVTSIIINTNDGVESVVSLDIKATVTEIDISAMAIEFVSGMLPGAVVVLPLHVVATEGEIVVDPFVTSTGFDLYKVNYIKEEEVIMENTTINATEVITEEENPMFAVFEEMFEDASAKLLQYGDKRRISKVMTLPDNEVYEFVIEELRRASIKTIPIFAKCKPVIEGIKSLVNKIPGTGTDNTILAKIKAIAAFIFRKAYAIAKGVATFTVEGIAIATTMVARIGYHVARELFFAGKEIGKSFNTNIISNVRNA